MMRKELGLDDGEMPKMGEGEGDEDGPSEPESDMSDYEDMGDYEDKEDAFMARYRRRQDLETAAQELGVDDADELKTDALKAAVVDASLGDGAAAPERIDSQCESIIEMLDRGTAERDDSHQKLSKRAEQANRQSRRDGDSAYTGAWSKVRT